MIINDRKRSSAHRTLQVLLSGILAVGLVQACTRGLDQSSAEEAMMEPSEHGNGAIEDPSSGPTVNDGAPQDERLDRHRKTLVSSLAGSWYEADPDRLRQSLQGYLQAAAVSDPPEPASIRALIQPHAGYRFAGAVAAHGMSCLRGLEPSRVIVMGPSHQVRMPNCASIPDATHLVTPLGEVPLDLDLIATLERQPFFLSIAAAHRGEHSVQIQVPFLQAVLGSFKLVPIVVGQIDLEMARAMADALLSSIDEKTLVVASSDFTHYGPRYGFVPFHDDLEANLRNLDMGAFEMISQIDARGFSDTIARTGATICGRDPIKILLSMLSQDTTARLLAYDTSGRATGDTTNSVSYLSAALCGTWRKVEPDSDALSAADRRTLLDLAHRTVRYVLEKNALPSLEDLGAVASATLREPRGVFVTLKKHGRLRGCIGQITPGPPLCEAVIRMAMSSALRDSRFTPVGLDELPDLTFEISVLTPPRLVSSYRDIVIGKHGIILRKAGRSAVFLPQVAPEQGWTLEQTLDQLARKAGLSTSAWREGSTFMVFEAEVFGDDDGQGG